MASLNFYNAENLYPKRGMSLAELRNERYALYLESKQKRETEMSLQESTRRPPKKRGVMLNISMEMLIHALGLDSAKNDIDVFMNEYRDVLHIKLRSKDPANDSTSFFYDIDEGQSYPARELEVVNVPQLRIRN